MSNFDSDGPSENEWDERGELAWNEFDWERYLREQDDVIHRYLAFYEKLKTHPERIDEVAHMMGWDDEEWTPDPADPESRAEADDDDDDDAGDTGEFDSEPYTLHKNPIYIATKAIYLSLKRPWELMASDPSKVPQSLALTYHASLYRGEEQAMIAIQALDFGDYALAISLFKRALRDLNASLAFLSQKAADNSKAIVAYRTDSLARIFDLREIWLRVMNECRGELERPVEDDDED